MSKGAWRYDALERNTKMIKEFCEKYKFEYRELTPYQFRIEELLDVYPVRQKWHWVKTDERGVFASQSDLKAILLERLPEIEDAPSETAPTGKEYIAPTAIIIDGKEYEVGSYSPAYSDGSRQATLRIKK